MRVIGSASDDRWMFSAALAVSQSEADEVSDAFAWFNVGSDLVGLHRTAEAAAAFDRARQIGLPWRMLWYQQTPYQAYFAEGRYDDVLALAQQSLGNAANLEESLFWRGRAEAMTGDTDRARASYNSALKLNPSYVDARLALADLEQVAP